MSFYTCLNFNMQVLVNQLHYLANKNAELIVLPLLWLENCIGGGGGGGGRDARSVNVLFITVLCTGIPGHGPDCHYQAASVAS